MKVGKSLLEVKEKLEERKEYKQFKTNEFKAYAIHPAWESVRIACFYLLLGVLWMCYPNYLINRLTHNAANFYLIDITKGLAFVVFTSIVIFVMINKRLNLYKYAALKSELSYMREKEQEIKLHNMAYVDSLTGLPNRMAFEERLFELLEKEKDKKHAVLFLDIDNFKNINDALGHYAGDCFLQHISVVFKENLGRDSFVARLGGDEFAVILEDIDNRTQIADKIISMFERVKQPWIYEKQEFYESVSVGIAIYPEDGNTISLLLRNADIAMYCSKDLSKDCFTFYEKKFREEKTHKVTMINDLHHAMVNDEFELYYQPILDLRSSEVIGVESLIRWHHPTKGLVSPAEFIPVAEETGMIHRIGDWVLETALRQKAEWEKQGRTHFRISVNISGYSLTQQGFVERIGELLEKYEVCAEDVLFEITETAVIRELAASLQVLRQLRNMKLKIALDDFGTGYSSFNYLKSLPIDIVKLDRSFVKDIAGNNNDSAIVQSVIKMTHVLNMKILAEGIENNEQLSMLCKNQCNYGQGFLFSKPLPLDEFTMILEEKCAV